MSDYRPATVRIPVEGASIQLDSFSPFVLPGTKAVVPSDGSHCELVLHGLLDVEEGWDDPDQMELLRGALVVNSVSFEVIG